MKILNDKYYTPINIANYCWDLVDKYIGLHNVTEVVEPSCGNGAFYHYNKRKIDIGYDIIPEIEGAIKQDYLTIEKEYKEGRLLLGNPPYGSRLALARDFYKKSCELGDYIGFILPISQYNNTNFLYEFDLIYSEDLGIQKYTDRKIHCCFNIYKRPLFGINKRKKIKLNDISIYRQDSKHYQDQDYDIRMCYWGDSCAGKILTEDETYASEYKIKIHNDLIKDDVINLLSTFDWNNYLKCVAMKKIQQHHIIAVLKENIEGIS